jgi:hypothetical protein
LKRRATLLAGVTQPVRGNLGFKVIAHDLILNMNWHSPNSADKYYFEIDQINFDLTPFIG